VVTEPPEDDRDRVVLRDERDGPERRYLEASRDAAGDLHLDGQDLGPGTGAVSGDGEYEWFQTIRAAHVGALLVALGHPSDADVLEVLARTATGAGSYRLEALLRTGVVPVERQVWSG
jgi:hypothetical protein